MTDTNYCVYFHKSNKSGEVFYVGKGRPNRPYENRNRSKDWYNFVKESNGFTADIVKSNLTNKEASELESSIIKSGKYNLINTLSSHVVKDGILDIIDSFEYDVTSPTFLRWKTPLHGSNKKFGDVAGSFGNNRYATVYHKGKSFKVHRVIWVMHHKIEIPEGKVINHIDCDTSNNAIDNLECVTICENNQRSKTSRGVLSKANTSGLNGIFKSDKGNKTDCYSYVAYYKQGGNQESRSFSVRKYGESCAKEMAIAWRDAMVALDRDKTHGEELLASFDKRYGHLFYNTFPEGVFVTKDSGYEMFMANITFNKKTKRKKFSIKKYGYDEAYRLACEWRKQMEELYYK